MKVKKKRSLKNIGVAILDAGKIGGVFGIIFLICAITASFLVTGDGHASIFTYFMIGLVELPINLLGLSHIGMAFPAAFFWGGVLFIGILFFKIINMD